MADRKPCGEITDIIERLTERCNCPNYSCGAEDECRLDQDAVRSLQTLKAENERLRAGRQEVISFLKHTIVGWRAWYRHAGQSPFEFITTEVERFLTHMEGRHVR